jgi:hypothetical protein
MDDDSKPNLIKKVKKQLTKMKSSPSNPKVNTGKDKADGKDEKGSMEEKTEDLEFGTSSLS